MAGCVLRVSGRDFDVDGFLASSELRPASVYRRGEPRTKASRERSSVSGFNLAIGDAENDVAEQGRQAVEFIREHREELARARAFPGVEDLVLDFATVRSDVLVQNETFTAELIAKAASVGMAVQLSLYSGESV